MPSVYIRNSSEFQHENEIKIGVGASSSCDLQLEKLGDFLLGSGDEKHIINIDETTDFYWKNIYEKYWTHRTIYHFEDKIILDVSRTISGEDRIDTCDSDLKLKVEKGELSPLSFESSIFSNTNASSLKMVDGFASWKHVDIFCKISRTAATNGYAAFLPTFNVDSRPDGKHYEVIAVKDSAGYTRSDENRNLLDYGAGKYCGATFCYIKCPSVHSYFRYTASNHVTNDSNIAGAIPTFCFAGGGEILRPVVLFVNKGTAKHSVFRAELIGSPDPDGSPENLIQAIVKKGMSFPNMVAAYPDFHHAFDPRPGIGRVFGVTEFYEGSADILWLPESEIN